MKKTTLCLVTLSLLLWYAFVHPFSSPQTTNDRIKDHLYAILRQSQQVTTTLSNALADSSSLPDTTSPTVYLNELFKHYRSMQWVLLPLKMGPSSAQVNNSKYWVLHDSLFTRQIQDAGALQVLEKIIANDQRETDRISGCLNEWSDFLGEVRSKVEQHNFSVAEVFCALSMDLYQQYFVSLTAHDRLDTSRVMPEAIYQLEMNRSLLSILPVEDWPSRQARTQQLSVMHRLIKVLMQRSFSGLDRLSLLQKQFVPLAQQLAQCAEHANNGTLPDWADHLNLSQKHPFEPEWLKSSSFVQPAKFRDQTAAVALGRLLFNEPMFSGNNKRTCASCHKPQKAFSDGRQTSLGFDFSARLPRNAPSLYNVIYNREFGHDMRETELNGFLHTVVEHRQELRTSFREIVEKLNSSLDYQHLFRRAFFQQEIDSTVILQALSQYMMTLQSIDAPFDRFMRQEDTCAIQPIAVRGYNLFMGKAACGSCHFAPLFSGLKPIDFQTQEYHSFGTHIGLIIPGKTDDDQGIKVHDLNYFFKTPGLRNLRYTGPYMHNGIFMELSEVLEFIEHSPDGTIRSLPDGYIQLSKQEKQAILAFLDTLNEEAATTLSDQVDLPETDGRLAPKKRRSAGIY